VDQDGDLPELEIERACGIGVVDLVDDTDLDEVVAGADRAELVAPALDRARSDLVRIRARQGAAALDSLQVGRRPNPFSTAQAAPPTSTARPPLP
jgi:hypothetical protein